MIIFILGILAVMTGAGIAIWFDVALGLKIIFTSLIATPGLLVIVGALLGVRIEKTTVADEKDE